MLFDDVIMENSKLTSTPYGVSLNHSKSMNIHRKKQVLFSEEVIPDEKCKISTKTTSTSILNDKTSNMNFNTPKQYKTRTATSSTRMNILPSHRTPVKRYFNDNILSEATPDCFSVVQVEIPSSKSNELGVEDQTVCEGESSNLTVGIRVRPLSSK